MRSHRSLHKDFTWLASNADGITLCGVLLEVKSRTRRELFDDEMYNHYYETMQVLIAMEIFDLPCADIIQFCTNSGRMRVRRVQRNSEFFYKHLAGVRIYMANLYSLYKEAILNRERYPLHKIGIINTNLVCCS